MTKKRAVSRKTRKPKRETNWMLIGGVVVGVLVIAGLFYLLFDAINNEGAPEPDLLLSEYCQENPERCPSKGSADAPVEIVEVSDYACHFCRDFNQETSPLLEDLYLRQGQVQWVSLPYALGTETVPAAEASLCAADQDKYFEFHEYIFDNQDNLQEMISSDFRGAAAAIELDQQSFESCVSSRIHRNDIDENIRAASRAGVGSTPTFFVDDELLRGNQPLATFQQYINLALSASQ